MVSDRLCHIRVHQYESGARILFELAKKTTSCKLVVQKIIIEALSDRQCHDGVVDSFGLCGSCTPAVFWFGEVAQIL